MDASAFDTSFGVDGKSRLDVAGLFDSFDTVLALPDGKLLVGGTSTFGISDRPAGQQLPVREESGVVLRFNADGTPDLTFDGDGIAEYPDDPHAYVPWQEAPQHPRIHSIFSLAVQPDGKVLAGSSALHYRKPPPNMPQTLDDGTPLYRSSMDLAVIRYNADGKVDRTFGSNGIALGGYLDLPQDGTAGSAMALAVQPDGKIVSGGTVSKSAGGDRNDMTVVRFNADGSLDATFGRQFIDFPDASGGRPRSDALTTLAIQADGKLLLGGGTGASKGDGDVEGGLALARLNPDGTRDTTFGDRGYVVTRFPAVPDPIDLRGMFDGTNLQQLTVRSDGRILVVGGLGTAYFLAARYNADGSLDASFGDDGRVFSRGVVYGSYRGVEEPGGGLTISGVGNGTTVLRAENSVSTRGTGMEAYVAHLDASGHVLSAARAERLQMNGEEGSGAVAVQADGKLVAVGRANPTVWDPLEHLSDPGDSPAYQVHSAATDGLVVRIDPALLTPDDSAGRDLGGGGTGGGMVSMFGNLRVRRGKVAKLRLMFGSAAEARAAAVMVSGPNGFSAEARLLKVKSKRRGTTVATFVVAAPGGKFDAADVGPYDVRLAGAAAEAPPVGQFVVVAPVKKRQRDLPLV